MAATGPATSHFLLPSTFRHASLPIEFRRQFLTKQIPRDGFEFEFGSVGHRVPCRENSVRRRIRGAKKSVIGLPFRTHAKRNRHDPLCSGLSLNFPALFYLAIPICLQMQLARFPYRPLLTADCAVPESTRAQAQC